MPLDMAPIHMVDREVYFLPPLTNKIRPHPTTYINSFEILHLQLLVTALAHMGLIHSKVKPFKP